MTNDRILFVVPPCITLEDFQYPKSNARLRVTGGKSLGNVLADMPLGVLSMSAYVKKHTTVSTKLVDFNIELNKAESFEHCSFKEFFQSYFSSSEVVDFSPSVIAISALFAPAYQNMIDIANVCRKIFPETYIFAGGALPTNMYKEIFSQSDDFDALCYGEGELSLLAFLQAEDKCGHLEENPTWITKEKVEAGREFEWSFIENLDDIPFYDYDLCDVDDYGISPAIIAYSAVGEKTQNFHVMTSRGCNFRCTFCSSHTVHGRKLRYFSLERVKEDFAKLKEKYGAHTLIFQDDHFLADKQRALAIIEIVKELDVKSVFQNGLALFCLTRDVLEALKSAGVKQLVLAVESGSQRVLRELMHKPLTLDIVERVVKDCRDLGIYADINLIIGMPGETKKDIADARIFLKTIFANWFRITVATPLVGSDMYHLCVANGYIQNNFADCHYKKAIVKTEDFTPEDMEEIQYSMNLELNFVENSDFRVGDYVTALEGFENAIRARGDHAIAYYYAGLCYERLNNTEKASLYLETARSIVSRDMFWRNYVDTFDIPL